jgi:hypothetical protein
MLGCHDFCGYYEWTFHYLRRRFGRSGLEKYWAQAIALDSQTHYIAAAKSKGLRGLYESWSQTGVDEQCDWTVTLDEAQNLVRLDMRECPSKGFLLGNRLNADEDYCDHCIGWIGPALDQAGFEVAAHEHNHCGQCWWEIRARDRSQPLVQIQTDIRQDTRWGHGYIHRFLHHERSLCADWEFSDSSHVLADWFRSTSRIAVLGAELSDRDLELAKEADTAVVVSGECYANAAWAPELVRGVLLEHEPALLAAVARQFHAVENPPLLMHPYLPGGAFLDFREHDLPRAVPILPLLIRAGVYIHEPNVHPSVREFATSLAAALHKETLIRGFDDDPELLRHPSPLKGA